MAARSSSSGREAAKLPQIDKFRELAREIGADEDEEAFKAKLRKVAEAPRQPKPEPKP
jgi:hypothetical protein